jgi:hypothetical protein
MSGIKDWPKFIRAWSKEFGNEAVEVSKLIPIALDDEAFGRRIKKNPSKSILKSKRRELINAIKAVASNNPRWGSIKITRSSKSEWFFKLTVFSNDFTEKGGERLEARLGETSQEPITPELQQVVEMPQIQDENALESDNIWEKLSAVGVVKPVYKMAFGTQMHDDQQAVMELVEYMSNLGLSDSAIAKMLEMQRLDVEGLSFDPQMIATIRHTRRSLENNRVE